MTNSVGTPSQEGSPEMRAFADRQSLEDFLLDANYEHGETPELAGYDRVGRPVVVWLFDGGDDAPMRALILGGEDAGHPEPVDTAPDDLLYPVVVLVPAEWSWVAVVVSSPATPAETPALLDQFQRMLDQMAFKHPTGEWFVSRTVVQGEIDRARQNGPEPDWPDAASSSPATPNGQGAGISSSWRTMDNPYDRPPAVAAEGMNLGPGSIPPAPSPASPAETREGREARKPLPEPQNEREARWFSVVIDRYDPIAAMALADAEIAAALAASPAAVPLPEESEKP